MGSFPPFPHCSNVTPSQRLALTILYKIEQRHTHIHAHMHSHARTDTPAVSIPPILFHPLLLRLSRPNGAVSVLIITSTVPATMSAPWGSFSVCFSHRCIPSTETAPTQCNHSVNME